MDGLSGQVEDAFLDITLEITRDCPLNCLICSSNGGTPHPNELSLETWKRIIDESLELGAKSFLLSGGEPLCSPYFYDICNYISKKEVNLSIYTSGNIRKGGNISPILNEDLEFISQLNNIKLIFSLESSSNKIHDLMTQVKGSFDNTIESIKLAVSSDIYSEVHFVPTLLNYKDLPNVVALSRKLGVKKVSILRFVPQKRGEIYKDRLLLKKEDIINLKTILQDLSKTYDGFIRIGSPFSPFGIIENSCNCGMNRITIRYDGKAFPCEAMKFLDKTYNDNDVTSFPLGKIYFHSELFSSARNVQKTFLSSECRNCEIFSKCKGGCPAQRMLLNDLSVMRLDPICSDIKVRIK